MATASDDLLPKFIQEIETYNRTAKKKGTIRVYERGNPGYDASVEHYFENGIKEVTPFVLEPGSELDVIVLIYLLALRKISFAIKSGGHISIPKIYPPDGVLISMKQFNDVSINKDTGVLDVGSGATWGDVYDFLDKPEYSKLGVVGGDPLVGVSGWLLGGGYSLLTNIFGLGMDNVVEFQVITPNSTSQLQDLPNDPTVRNANHEENRDLFKALKGGGHNFGIVTRFSLQTYAGAERQTLCFRHFGENMSSKIKTAMVKFIQSGAPPEAVALMSFRHDYRNSKLEFYIGLAAWYYSDLKFQEGRDLVKFFFGDLGETTSLRNVHEAFALRHLPVSLESLQRSDEDSEFVAFDPEDETHAKFFKHNDIIEKKILTSLTGGADRNSFSLYKAGKKTLVMERDLSLRGRMASIMVTTYTLKLLDEAEKQAKKLANLMPNHDGKRVSFEIWPFHKDAFNGITTRESAWPHEQGKVSGPLVGWFEWTGKENDAFWLGEIENALETLRDVALREGCTIKGLPIYLNITLENTLVKDIYGVNYGELKGIRNKYDPTNVMKQAAGFLI